jgi:hypothetical protein
VELNSADISKTPAYLLWKSPFAAMKTTLLAVGAQEKKNDGRYRL